MSVTRRTDCEGFHRRDVLTIGSAVLSLGSIFAFFGRNPDLGALHLSLAIVNGSPIGALMGHA